MTFKSRMFLREPTCGSCRLNECNGDITPTASPWRAARRTSQNSGKRSSCFGSVGQFPPGDQLNFLLSQNLAELVTGEKIVVALSPGRAPRGALPGGGAQFVIVVTGMDDELRHAGFQVLQRSEVKLRPLFRRNF